MAAGALAGHGSEPVAAFPTTIFAGAFLLFQIQPLIARYILPWFGGGPAVWTTAVLFFQVLLLAGYAYAHWSLRRLGPRSQAAIHVALLLAALAVLPITPSDLWKPEDIANPTAQILLLLTVTVGLPYFVLASTSPLLQAWVSRLRAGAPPYRLFALSNTGSLLALLTYPFLVEPTLGRASQVALWSWGFGVYALFSCACAATVWRGGPEALAPMHAAPASKQPAVGTWSKTKGQRKKRPGGSQPERRLSDVELHLLWLGLPAAASTLLLATTNQLSQDVATVPLLWVLPLSLYLLSFIIVFERERWYHRPTFAGALVPAMGLALWLLFQEGGAPIRLQICGYSLVLFACCMACHGELARLKPEPSKLTGYYLMIAAGGALGGAFVTLVAPLIFDSYLEMHVGLLLCCALVAVALRGDRRSALYRGRPRWAWSLLGIAFLGLTLGLGLQSRIAAQTAIETARNFYGVLQVTQEETGTRVERVELIHGSTRHGLQFRLAEKRGWPTTYYSGPSGAGLVFGWYANRSEGHFGFIGLGIGTLATYGKPGDRFRFYEINPEVERIARTHFSYLEDSKADLEVILGDARLSLEREEPQGFDVLFLDAFNSDAIPVHLLTAEAFEVYDRHLVPNGVIAVHTSNKHLYLRPVVERLARHLGFESLFVFNQPDPRGFSRSRWLILSRNKAFIESDFSMWSVDRRPVPAGVDLWTDDYSNPFQVLRGSWLASSGWGATHSLDDTQP